MIFTVLRVINGILLPTSQIKTNKHDPPVAASCDVLMWSKGQMTNNRHVAEAAVRSLAERRQ